jgi:hypothetical protein
MVAACSVMFDEPAFDGNGGASGTAGARPAVAQGGASGSSGVSASGEGGVASGAAGSGVVLAAAGEGGDSGGGAGGEAGMAPSCDGPLGAAGAGGAGTDALLPALIGSWVYDNYAEDTEYVLTINADGSATYDVSSGDAFGLFDETWSGSISIDQHVITLDASTVTTSGAQLTMGHTDGPPITSTLPPETLRFRYAYRADLQQLRLGSCDGTAYTPYQPGAGYAPYRYGAAPFKRR